MSSYDSVSIVYKCMLRGAADFLVKPVRKNELKNLWQHVWRRQAVSPYPYFFNKFALCFRFSYYFFVLNKVIC